MSLFGKVMDFASRTVWRMCEIEDDGLRKQFTLSVEAYQEIEKKLGVYKQKIIECGELFGIQFVVDSETATPIKLVVLPNESEVK